MTIFPRQILKFICYVYQPCLGGGGGGGGGDSKTLMFVNISPDPSSLGESLSFLHDQHAKSGHQMPGLHTRRSCQA